MQASAAIAAGDPIAARSAAEEGRDLADAIGDRFNSRQCRMCLGLAQSYQGDLAGAAAQFGEVAAEAKAGHDGFHAAASLAHQGTVLALQGETDAARAAADASLESASEFGALVASVGYFALGNAALAAGDVGTARDATAAAWEHGSVSPAYAALLRPVIALAALAGGDLIAARHWADEAVATATGWTVMSALNTRARVAIAQGEPEQAERDAHDALAIAAEHPGALWRCRAPSSASPPWPWTRGSYREAAPALRRGSMPSGTASARCGSKSMTPATKPRWRRCEMRWVRTDFDAAWAEGAALSIEEAIAYAQRGRGERKRPTSGWASLTPTEREVVQLVSEGLANNDIAARLFISPRTVQSHLTHVYTKLGLNSRVQLAQEAARHN